MDKRNFIFIFLFTITIFFVHHYFIADKPSTQQESPVQIIEEKPLVSDSEIMDRTAKVSSLPLADLYSDAQGQKFFAASLQFNDCFMVYPATEELSKTLFVKSKSGSLQPLSVLVEATKTTPAIYSSNKNATFYSIHLPQSGNFDVQLIYTGDDASQVFVKLATYENGQIHFFKDFLDQPAIVVAKDQNQFYPIGFYVPDSNQILPINYSGPLAKIVTFKATSTIKNSQVVNEKFYVLENEYVQLVFSDHGGALSEINLPFKTKINPLSVVLPIGFDKTIEKKYPRNSYFPSANYYKAGSSNLSEPSIGGYYPLLRRDIEGSTSSGKQSFQTPSRFYALNVVSEAEPEFAQKPYQVKRFDKNLIEFELVSDQRRINKVFSLSSVKDEMVPYTFNLQLRIDGDSRNLQLSTGVPEVELISGSPSPDLKYRYLRNGKPVVEKLKLPKDNATLVRGIVPSWICNSNGFFGVVINPINDQISGFEAFRVPGEIDPTRLSIIDAQHNLYPADKYPGYLMYLPLKGNVKQTNFRIFTGPFDQTVLNKADSLLKDPTTGTSPGFSAAQSFHGWFVFISEPFAKFLFIIMKFFYSFTHSWGLCIILITIVLRVILYPLNAWSIKSITRMQMYAPEIAAIKKRHTKDPKRANLEVMQFYKEKKINPLSGCFPQLIQLPFLIGMFDLLKSAFPLRGTSFIPGWIDNLTASDVVFSWSYPIFFFGTQFHLLPFILGGLTFFQQKMSQSMNKGKIIDPEAQKQSKMTNNMITIVFTLLFYNFPSGLNIYWISSTLLGILQTWFTYKKLAITEKLPKKV